MYYFDSVNEQVSITPMKHLFCERIMRYFKKEFQGLILPNQCYTNALMAAEWFNEHNFYVEVVEGLYQHTPEAIAKYAKRGVILVEEPIEHRFCKKGDKYFDPTIEFLFGWDEVKTFTYTAQRIWDQPDLLDVAYETDKLFGKPAFCSSITGLCYHYTGKGNEQVPIYYGHVNDNGEFVPPKENPFETARSQCVDSWVYSLSS